VTALVRRGFLPRISSSVTLPLERLGLFPLRSDSVSARATALAQVSD